MRVANSSSIRSRRTRDSIFVDVITHVSSGSLLDYSLLLKARGLCRARRRTLASPSALRTRVKGTLSSVDLSSPSTSTLPLYVVFSGDISQHVITSFDSHSPYIRSLRICLHASRTCSVLNKTLYDFALNSYDAEIPLAKARNLPEMPENS